MVRTVVDPDGYEWPQWVPVICFGVALLTIGLGVAQRGSRAIGLPLVAGLIALSPFLIDAAGAFLGTTRHQVRLGLFPIPVLVGSALLVWYPSQVDFAPFALCFMTGEVTARAVRDRWIGVAAAMGSAMVMLTAEFFGPFDGAYVWIIGIGFSAFGGYLVQVLQRQTYELREAQSGLTEKAAADERSRVAREVHDVIAHSMSVTMLHITAARMALERNQSADALESLREAETQGRNSLNDIRRTVGLLGPDAEAKGEPAPTVTDLPKLIDDFRTAGLDVMFDMHGDVRNIAPAAGLNIYRIAQESLTNAAKYGSGAQATMSLNVADDQITLFVRNDAGNGSAARPSGNGLGVRGMRERAALLGGTLQTGADGDGWVVFLTAPREVTA